MKSIVVCPLNPDNDTEYKILQVTDSLDHTPGMKISRRVLHDLCIRKTWKVTVKLP